MTTNGLFPAGGASAAAAELNAAQREAVDWGGAGPGAGALLIIAGAGSGKTTTLAHRVAQRIVLGCDPNRILLMTFSRRAAAELERRTGAVVARALQLAGTRAPPALPWSGTFHSVGARLLRDYAPQLHLSDSFTVADRGDAADLMGLVRQELGLAQTRSRFPTKDTCLAIYSRAVNSQLDLGDVLAAAFPWCAAWHDELKRLFAAYVRAKEAGHVLDYDDLLLYWAEMMTEPTLARAIDARFDHVFVDEYQDTNALQASIVRAIKPSGSGVTVVGDDAQAIYSFRAATVRNILDFPRAFAAPCRVMTLDQNYRSTAPILAASNEVMARARERYCKDLWTEREGERLPRLVAVADEAAQARYVADEVLVRRESGLALRRQAVLFRSASHSAPLELELARRNIPFVKYGGLKFLEAAHVKDVLAVLRWAENPRGRMAGFRAVQLVPGIGPATAARLMDEMAGAAEPVATVEEFAVPAGARADWALLSRLFAALRHAADWPADFERARRWYLPHLDRLYEASTARSEDLSQLGRIAASFATRERFLTELALDPPELSSDMAGEPYRDEDYLILSTIHSAKGQEWPAVTVLNVVDGCIPSDLGTGSDEALDEERRLLYVAMTRARDHLDLVVPQRFYVHGQSALGDRHVYAQRSRFIEPSMLKNFEEVHWPAAATASVPGAAPVQVDLAARLARRWD